MSVNEMVLEREGRKVISFGDMRAVLPESTYQEGPSQSLTISPLRPVSPTYPIEII